MEEMNSISGTRRCSLVSFGVRNDLSGFRRKRGLELKFSCLTSIRSIRCNPYFLLSEYCMPPSRLLAFMRVKVRGLSSCPGEQTSRIRIKGTSYGPPRGCGRSADGHRHTVCQSLWEEGGYPCHWCFVPLASFGHS